MRVFLVILFLILAGCQRETVVCFNVVTNETEGCVP